MYDISEKVWYVWSVVYTRGVVSGRLAGGTSSRGVIDANPIVYTVTGVQDAGTNPAFTIITPKVDNIDPNKNTSHLRKFNSKLSIGSDNPGSATLISVSYADDDYQTYSTARTLDINNYAASLSGLGSFFERAYKLSYTGSNNLKLYTLNLDLDLGMK